MMLYCLMCVLVEGRSWLCLLCRIYNECTVVPLKYGSLVLSTYNFVIREAELELISPVIRGERLKNRTKTLVLKQNA